MSITFNVSHTDSFDGVEYDFGWLRFGDFKESVEDGQAVYEEIASGFGEAETEEILDENTLIFTQLGDSTEMNGFFVVNRLSDQHVSIDAVVMLDETEEYQDFFVTNILKSISTVATGTIFVRGENVTEEPPEINIVEG